MRISDWSSDVCSSDLRNPSGELPTLVDRDTVLHPASVVAQYLDERYPHPALMPADAASRARVRMVLTHFDRELFPAAAAIRAAPKSPDDRRARKKLPEALISDVRRLAGRGQIGRAQCGGKGGS